MWTTADLCDEHSSDPTIQIAISSFKQFGGKNRFCGLISTAKLLEDNVLIRETLSKQTVNRVLIVDGAGSKRCALLGDNLASIAKQNGWQGIVINGCVRDSAELVNIDIGILAVASHPLKSNKNGKGELDIGVSFSGINFQPNHYFYADNDGIIVSKTALLNKQGHIIKRC